VGPDIVLLGQKYSCAFNFFFEGASTVSTTAQ